MLRVCSLAVRILSPLMLLFIGVAGIQAQGPVPAGRVLPIKVIPRAAVVYTPVSMTLPEGAAAAVRGLPALGIRPENEKYQLMGQLVPRSEELELHFILEAGLPGEPQQFEVLLEKPAIAIPEIFGIEVSEGKHIDLFYNKKGLSSLLTRMVLASEPGDSIQKVYNAVYDDRGDAPITSDGAPGSVFPHHRGIFLGWSKTGFQGKTYDTWHMTGGVHQKFEQLLSRNVGPVYADYSARISWNTGSGERILEEDRTIKALHPTNKGYAVLEVDTVLKAVTDDVVLDGDPEHAGCHFRATNQVAEIALAVKNQELPASKATAYRFHARGIDPKKAHDLPWAAMGFSAGGNDGENRYFVQFMSHPTVPEGSLLSAYRDYGRFGGFPKATIAKGESLRLRYRFVIGIGAFPPVPFLQSSYEGFALPPVIEAGE